MPETEDCVRLHFSTTAQLSPEEKGVTPCYVSGYAKYVNSMV